MKIVFSRKGFDSTAGGGPSPIVDDVPVTLPIPDTKGIARTTYGDLGLGELAEKASRGKFGRDSLCHHDPMFLADGKCVLGQCQSSQGHLAKQGVGTGDVFLFFGLFEDPQEDRHHRIFGYLQIEETVDLTICGEAVRQRFRAISHPHAFGLHGRNDMLYVGPGCTAQKAREALRLTVPGGPVGMWHRPPWLERGGISYFADRDENWPAGRMYRVGNGQEFVADVGNRPEPREWLDQIIAEIKRS